MFLKEDLQSNFFKLTNIRNTRRLCFAVILYFQSFHLRFQCKICLSPREKDNINSVSWNFAGKDDVGLQELELTENIFVSPDDKTLHLYNLREEHTGEYICRLGQALTAPYFLTVGNNETVDEVFYKIYSQLI